MNSKNEKDSEDLTEQKSKALEIQEEANANSEIEPETIEAEVNEGESEVKAEDAQDASEAESDDESDDDLVAGEGVETAAGTDGTAIDGVANEKPKKRGFFGRILFFLLLFLALIVFAAPRLAPDVPFFQRINEMGFVRSINNMFGFSTPAAENSNDDGAPSEDDGAKEETSADVNDAAGETEVATDQAAPALTESEVVSDGSGEAITAETAETEAEVASAADETAPDAEGAEQDASSTDEAVAESAPDADTPDDTASTEAEADSDASADEVVTDEATNAPADVPTEDGADAQESEGNEAVGAETDATSPSEQDASEGSGVEASNPQDTELSTELSDVEQAVAEISPELANQNTDAAQLAAISAQMGAVQVLEGRLSNLSTENSELATANAALEDEVEQLRRELEEAKTLAEAQIQNAAKTREQLEAELDAFEELAGKSDAAIALAELKLALFEGRQIEEQAAAVQEAGIDLPAEIMQNAEGVASIVDLQNDFGGHAMSAIRASMRASEGDGVFDALFGRISSEFTGRSLTPQEGNTPDAVLSRAEDLLRQGALEDALSEISVLPSEALAEMAPWVEEANARLDALAAVDALINRELQ